MYLDYFNLSTKFLKIFKLAGWSLAGVLLMEIRENLAPETEFESTRIEAAHLNGVVVILNDGEILAMPEKRNNVVNKTHIRNASCFLCGENGHIARVCRLRNKGFACFRCGQSGHKAANCTSRQGYRPYVSGPRPLLAQNTRRPMGF